MVGVVAGQAEERHAGAVLLERDVERLERAAGGVDDDLEVAVLADQLGRLDDLDRRPGGAARGEPDAAGDEREHHDEGEQLPHGGMIISATVPTGARASVRRAGRGVEARPID